MNTTTAAIQGFTPSPNTRGSLDIVWSCVSTLFLCSWVQLCLNVPKPGASRTSLFYTKICLTFLCVLAPELTGQAAASQFLMACKTKKQFQALGYEKGPKRWTLTHSFYAEMGGFLVQPADGSRAFPVDGQQLHYLVSKGYVEYPQVNQNDIKDKNKSDGLLGMSQSLRHCGSWQVSFPDRFRVLHKTQSVADREKVSTLELSTAAFIFMSLWISAVWFKKPADVQTAHTLSPSINVTEILEGAGRSPDAFYSRTPLDFIREQEWDFSITWAHGIALLEKMRLVHRDKTKPIDHFGNTSVMPLPQWTYAVGAVVTMGYYGIITVAWNHTFPTTTERWFWRVSSVYCVFCVPLFWAILQFSFALYPWLVARWSVPNGSTDTNHRIIEGQKNGNEIHHTSEVRLSPSWNDDSASSTQDLNDLESVTRTRNLAHMDPQKANAIGNVSSRAGSRTKESLARVLHKCAEAFRNNSRGHDPALRAPLKAIAPLYLFGSLYCLARLYTWVEDFAELRALEKSAYQTVDWSWVWPHI
ncbi:MAG: hypothetical protein M1828_005878 [Chrysothrix sp. TS-e1954]|nr:MAG: hypothetical protein M1828_005878 [Chrysothrix sp. TS-e1954]